MVYSFVCVWMDSPSVFNIHKHRNDGAIMERGGGESIELISVDEKAPS